MGFFKGREMPPRAGLWRAALITAAMAFSVSGCTGPIEYLRNGLKVGPNYQTPQTCVEKHWIDATDARIHQEPTDLVQWWAVFQDPRSITSSSVPADRT